MQVNQRVSAVAIRRAIGGIFHILIVWGLIRDSRRKEKEKPSH